MSIVSITPYYVGEVDQLITRWKLVVTDSLSTLTTAGYLNQSNLMGFTPSPNDVFDVIYSYTGTIAARGTGTYTECTIAVAYSQGVATYTLSQVAQSGVSPSVVNDIPTFSNTTGGLQDSGILISNAVLKNASNQMAAAGNILLDKSTGSVSTGAVTINKQAGVITATVSTAAASTTSITFNNSEIVSTSVILVSLMGGSNTIPGVQLSCAYTSAGVATLVVTNNNVAGSSLSGTLIIGFIVV